MRKTVLTVMALASALGSAFAFTPSYKGYVETYWGVAFPQRYYDSGVALGVSTTHGITLAEGVFVGVGVDTSLATYEYDDGYSYDSGATSLFAVFAEGRYQFLRTKRISPFAGLRIGGGLNGYDDKGCFYLSPAIGCTFNLTKRFGLDASLGYSLFTGHADDYDQYGYIYAGNVHCLTLRFGLHF